MITKLNPEQALETIPLLQAMFSEQSDAYQEALATYLSNAGRNKHFWVAKLDEEVIGMAVCHEWKVIPKPGKSDRKYWHLANIFIKQGHRGKGIGRDLIETILKEVKAGSIEKIISWATGDHCEFLKQFGFEDENSVLLLKLS